VTCFEDVPMPIAGADRLQSRAPARLMRFSSDTTVAFVKMQADLLTIDGRASPSHNLRGHRPVALTIFDDLPPCWISSASTANATIKASRPRMPAAWTCSGHCKKSRHQDSDGDVAFG